MQARGGAASVLTVPSELQKNLNYFLHYPGYNSKSRHNTSIERTVDRSDTSFSYQSSSIVDVQKLRQKYLSTFL